MMSRLGREQNVLGEARGCLASLQSSVNSNAGNGPRSQHEHGTLG